MWRARARKGGCGTAADHASGDARTSAQRPAAALQTTPGAPGRSAVPAAVPRVTSQSAAITHPRPGTHEAHGPPQSTSDSPTSRSSLKHDASAGERDCVRLTDGEFDGDCEGVVPCEVVWLGDWEAVRDCVGECDGVLACDGEWLGVCVPLGVAACDAAYGGFAESRGPWLSLGMRRTG